MNEITSVEKVFEGQALAAYLWDGKPVWIAKEVGRVMGYSGDGERLTDLIRGEWKAEVIEGQDVELLTGERLAAFKATTPVTRGQLPIVDSRAPALLLLKEPGFHLVCIKTEKPIGRRLRRWLADEVMPSLLRTGAYRVNPQSTEDVFATYDQAVKAAMAKLASEGNVEAAKVYIQLKLVKPSDQKKPESEPAPPKEPIMREKIEALDREHPHLGYTEIARRLGTTRGYISRVLRRKTPPKK